MKNIGAFLWNYFEKIVRSVIGFLLKIVHIELSEKQWEKLMQFVKFCVVGCSNVLANLIGYWIFLYGIFPFLPWDPQLEIQISGVAGFFFIATNSYYWNGKFVFPSGSSKKRKPLMFIKAYLKVCISYSLSVLLIGQVLLWLWTNKYAISPAIAPLINQAITLPISFIINKFWAFKD